MQSHTHVVQTGYDGPYLPSVLAGGKAYFATNYYSGSSVNDGRSGTTTHGKRIGTNFIIKY